MVPCCHLFHSRGTRSLYIVVSSTLSRLQVLIETCLIILVLTLNNVLHSVTLSSYDHLAGKTVHLSSDGFSYFTW